MIEVGRKWDDKKSNWWLTSSVADPDHTFHSEADRDPDPIFNLMQIRILPLAFFQI
jgi:hypothetical protein